MIIITYTKCFAAVYRGCSKARSRVDVREGRGNVREGGGARSRGTTERSRGARGRSRGRRNVREGRGDVRENGTSRATVLVRYESHAQSLATTGQS